MSQRRTAGGILKAMPQVATWWECIDPYALAVHAVRCWDMPSNGEFILVTTAEIAQPGSWGKRVEFEIKAIERLKEREAILWNFYGRAWRHHMLDRIDWDARQPIHVSA